MNKPDSSVFARGDGAIHVVPMAVIQRPLPSELDEDKVIAFMEKMKVRDRSGSKWLMAER
jgi:sulfiredoxin